MLLNGIENPSRATGACRWLFNHRRRFNCMIVSRPVGTLIKLKACCVQDEAPGQPGLCAEEIGPAAGPRAKAEIWSPRRQQIYFGISEKTLFT
jgi:hypothetical protein